MNDQGSVTGQAPPAGFLGHLYSSPIKENGENVVVLKSGRAGFCS